MYIDFYTTVIYKNNIILYISVSFYEILLFDKYLSIPNIKSY